MDTLKGLPIEVWFFIAEHLTERDLINCSSTCRCWRDLFGSEYVWRRYYDKTSTEYFESTKCTVDPDLNSDNILRSLSSGRKCYVKKTQLWNNWKLGKYKVNTVCLGNIGNFMLPEARHKILFYSNDYLLLIQSYKLYVLDVKGSSTLYATLTLPDITVSATMFQVVNKNLVCVTGNLAIVLSINLTSKRIEVLHVLVLEAAEKSKITGDALKSNLLDNVECFIVGNIFLGYKTESQNFHIWNIDTGVKLKEEHFIQSDHSYISLIPCQKSMSCILWSVTEFESICTQHCVIYDLKKLDYTSFYVSRVGNNCAKCVTSNAHIAIELQGDLEIYNRQTSEVVYTKKIDGCLFVVRNNFVYRIGGILSVFNPFSRQVEAQYSLRSSIRYDNYRLQVVKDRFFVLNFFVLNCDCSDLYNRTTTFRNLKPVENKCDGNNQSSPQTIPLYRFGSNNYVCVNEVGSIFVLIVPGGIQLVKFW